VPHPFRLMGRMEGESTLRHAASVTGKR